MSGAAASVFLRSPLTAVQRAQLETFIGEASGSPDRQSFWVLGQPFTLSLHEPEDEERSFQLPGWSPAQTICICCHVRGQTGDVLLAFIAARVAEKFDGLIALEGKLTAYTANPSVLANEGRYASDELGVDVVTPGFLNYWAGMPDFRMCN